MADRFLDTREDELRPQQRLQPYLLDRLTRDPYEPDIDTALNSDQFKETLRRDLSWIFNTRSHPDCDMLARQFPLVASSAMNYGIVPFSGQTIGSLQGDKLVDRVREAIVRFEPRIVPGSLYVALPKASAAAARAMGASVIELIIEGQAVGIPERLSFRTSLDVATGVCEIQDKDNAKVG